MHHDHRNVRSLTTFHTRLKINLAKIYFTMKTEIQITAVKERQTFTFSTSVNQKYGFHGQTPRWLYLP